MNLQVGVQEEGRVREVEEQMREEGGVQARGEVEGDEEEEGVGKSDGSAETALGKRKRENGYAFFPIPVRRKILSEVPASTIGFMGDTSHIQLFVNQVNSTSKCSTSGPPSP